MAYAKTNPPVKVSQGPLAGFNTTESLSAGGAMWLYKSADAIATVNGAAYFSNGIELGMQKGDIVFVFDTNLVRWYFCGVVSTAAGTFAGTGSATINSTTTVLAD